MKYLGVSDVDHVNLASLLNTCLVIRQLKAVAMMEGKRKDTLTVLVGHFLYYIFVSQARNNHI